MTSTVAAWRNPKPRGLLLAMAASGLVLGVWSGLIRAGLPVPAAGPITPAAHGVLMVSGFFGALISLERAVALDRAWAYAAAPLAAVGAVGSAAGVAGFEWLTVVAALLLTIVGAALWRIQRTTFMAVIGLGGLAWSIATLLAATGASLSTQVPWLAAFLVSVIVGERLELSRLAPPSRSKYPVFFTSYTLFAVGTSMAATGLGWRVFGAGLLALALWLVFFDIARRTIVMSGVTRFIAICLLSGYGWMALAGAWWLVGGDLIGTLGWDGALHSLFVGFVLSMVFGHVHMVAPAVLGISIRYRSWFYTHVAVLHLSLGARVIGDLAGDAAMRRTGALGNGVAIVLFLVATASSARRRSEIPQRSAEKVTA